MSGYRDPILDQLIAVWDPKAYSGAGTTVREMIGGHNGTLIGSPGFTAGATPFFSLDGVDDVIEIPDHNDLDLTNARDLTFLISCDVKSTTPIGGALFAKQTDISTSASAGWGCRAVAGPKIRARATDGTTASSDNGTAIATNTRQTHGIVAQNNVSESVEAVEDGVLTGSPSTTTIGDCSNSVVLRIGSDANGTGFTEMDCYGCALWQRTLSQSEITAFEAALDAGILLSGRIGRGIMRGVQRGI